MMSVTTDPLSGMSDSLRALESLPELESLTSLGETHLAKINADWYAIVSPDDYRDKAWALLQIPDRFVVTFETWGLVLVSHYVSEK